MGQEWIGDQATPSHASPELLEVENQIGKQRELISSLEMEGHRELVDSARAVLDEMCSSLTRMRQHERREKIDAREKSFGTLSEEETMEHVLRTCPL